VLSAQDTAEERHPGGPPRRDERLLLLRQSDEPTDEKPDSLPCSENPSLGDRGYGHG
jgi:hypothetical protein